MVSLNFNAATVDPNTAFEALPSGQYPVIITASQQKPTANGQGSYLELEMTVQGGEFNGRKVFDRLNLQNKNQQTVEIAYRTLSAICYVTGVLQVQDSSQLHGKPFIAVVTKRRREDRPNEELYSNDVRGYKDINGNDPGKQGGTGSQQGAAPAWAGGQPTQQQPQPAPAPVQQNGNGGGQPAWAQAPVQQPQQQQPVQQPVQNNGFGGAPQQGQAPQGQQGGAPPWNGNAQAPVQNQGGGAPPWATGATQ
jgi:hypothetical protein